MKNATHIFPATNYNFSKYILLPSSFEIVAHSAFFPQTGEPLYFGTQNSVSSLGLFFSSISAKSFQIPIYGPPPPLMGSFDPKQWVALLPDTAGELKFITSFASPAKENPAWSLLCKVFGREGPPLERESSFWAPHSDAFMRLPIWLVAHFLGAAVLFSIFGGRSPPPKKKLMMSWTTF